MIKLGRTDDRWDTPGGTTNIKILGSYCTGPVSESTKLFNWVELSAN